MTPRIPVVPGPPVIGSLRDLKTTRMRTFLTRAYLDNGPVFELRVLGQRVVVLAGLDANQYASGAGRTHFTSDQAWGGLARHFGVPRAMINADGQDHLAFRRVEGRAYTHKAFVSTLDRTTPVITDALDALDALGPGLLPVAPWCKQVITEQVARAVVGGTTHPHLDDLVRYVQTTLMVNVTLQQPKLAMRRPAIRRAQRQVWAMADALLAERRRTGPGEVPDLVDMILAAEPGDPERWSENSLRLSVMGAFIAGMDTAANTMAFAILELTRRPELVPALVAEVTDAFADGASEEALRRVPRLIEFLFEVLRVHPIAPALQRHTAIDLEFAGHELPKDTMVILGTTVTHGLPDVFAEPWRFDPERFSPERAEHRTAGAYVPFGVGPHTCAGRGMAEGLLVLNLALLLQRVRFAGEPGYVLRQVARPTPSPDDRFRIRILDRTCAGSAQAASQP